MASNRQHPSIRPVYEDFRPLIEPKEDPQFNIIHIHLPGFLKDQIRIVAENGGGVLRVRGQRLIGANKWIRFLEELSRPEFCDMAQIAATFDGGILRITMPKKIANAPQTEAPIADIEPPSQPAEQPQTLAQEEAEPRKRGIEAQKQRMLPAECEAKERLKEDEEYRKAVKGVYWRRLEAERKLLVNVGVAVLVIAALIGSAWISYSMLTS